MEVLSNYRSYDREQNTIHSNIDCRFIDFNNYYG